MILRLDSGLLLDTSLWPFTKHLRLLRCSIPIIGFCLYFILLRIKISTFLFIIIIFIFMLGGACFRLFRSFKLFPENHSKLIKVFGWALFKDGMGCISIHGFLKGFDEIEVHLELINALELYSKSIKSTIILIFIEFNRVFLDLQPADTS